MFDGHLQAGRLIGEQCADLLAVDNLEDRMMSTAVADDSGDTGLESANGRGDLGLHAAGAVFAVRAEHARLGVGRVERVEQSRSLHARRPAEHSVDVRHENEQIGADLGRDARGERVIVAEVVELE